MEPSKESGNRIPYHEYSKTSSAIIAPKQVSNAIRDQEYSKTLCKDQFGLKESDNKIPEHEYSKSSLGDQFRSEFPSHILCKVLRMLPHHILVSFKSDNGTFQGLLWDVSDRYML